MIQVLHANNNKNNDYRFYRYEEVNEKWLSPLSLQPGTLCWVLRGRRSKSKKTNNQQQHSNEQLQRNILFQRAVVIETVIDQDNKIRNDNDEEQQRLLVRYPAGSTYRVRHVNLWPILQESSLVVCLEETLMYRRWALACTQANDWFVEIGCDVGILVHRVHALSSCPEHVWGLDTCRASILQAQKRFPNCHFRQWRVPLDGQQQQQQQETQAGELKEHGESKPNDAEDASQPTSYTRHLRPLPVDLFPEHERKDDNNLVVAIDINGNRELSVVQQCIQIVIQEWRPRLIIVKSETLYLELAKKGECIP